MAHPASRRGAGLPSEPFGDFFVLLQEEYGEASDTQLAQLLGYLSTHPETGGTTLFVNRVFTRGFSGADELDEITSSNLLNELLMNVGRAELTCRFRWAPGSVAMWDNRAVQHCATADFWPHKRLMERVTILDHDVSRRRPYFLAP